MTVFSVGVLPRLGLEPRTIGQQSNALTVRPFNAHWYTHQWICNTTKWPQSVFHNGLFLATLMCRVLIRLFLFRLFAQTCMPVAGRGTSLSGMETSTLAVRETGVTRQNGCSIKGPPSISQYDTAMIYREFQRGSKLDSPDAERRKQSQTAKSVDLVGFPGQVLISAGL